MRRRLFLILTLAALVLPFATQPVAADGLDLTAAASCPYPSHVYLAEDGHGLGDLINLCLSTPDLDAVAHTQAGYCNPKTPPGHDSWDNCTSSIYVWLPSYKCLTLYNGGGSFAYTFDFETIAGPRSGTVFELAGTDNDILSSFKFYNKDANGNC